MSNSVRQPWNPAVKDDNLRLTLARDEADFIAAERRGALRRIAGAALAMLIVAISGAVAVSLLDGDWNPLEGPWYSLHGFAAVACLAAMVPGLVNLVAGLLRFRQVRRFRADLDAFLTRYNRSLP